MGYRLLLTCAIVVLTAPDAAAVADAPLYYERGVISADTSWSGEVVVKGPCVVKKGATLTIGPGTNVRFVRVDEDADGIGDGELNVEGALAAVGTKDMPITFASAGPSPAPKDWTYVMFSHAGPSVMEHCEVRHAFTGVQVHWSRVRVTDCVFSENFEGMRFSTAVVDVEGNTFTGNSFGIRYESRGSKARIEHNDITGNGCGFFAVVKCEGGVTVRGNNIVNLEYNVKLGERQDADLDFIGNWWGTGDASEIGRSIFDGRADGALGTVAYEPFLSGAVEGAGVGR